MKKIFCAFLIAICFCACGKGGKSTKEDVINVFIDGVKTADSGKIIEILDKKFFTGDDKVYASESEFKKSFPKIIKSYVKDIKSYGNQNGDFYEILLVFNNDVTKKLRIDISNNDNRYFLDEKSFKFFLFSIEQVAAARHLKDTISLSMLVNGLKKYHIENKKLSKNLQDMTNVNIVDNKFKTGFGNVCHEITIDANSLKPVVMEINKSDDYCEKLKAFGDFSKLINVLQNSF